MPKNLFIYFFIGYVALISLISIIVTIYDKIAAKKLPRNRTPEATLLILSALGGSVVMFLTMILIRHKTKHVKFMLGIPLITLAQAVLIYLLLHFDIITF